MYRGIVRLWIPRIGRVRIIWDKLFFKLRVYFYWFASKKKVFLESSHPIYTNIDVVVEFIEFQRNVTFELCIDEEFIDFWRDYVTFHSPHATNFVEYPPSKRGNFLLPGTTVVGPWEFGESILSGEELWFLIITYLISILILSKLKSYFQVLIELIIILLETCSIPIYPLLSHSLVCIKNHLYIVGTVPIIDK